MNRHVNKKRQQVREPDPNLTKAETDGMPAEVATGLLCQTNMSNRMRKQCWHDRNTHWVSNRQPTPVEERTMRRLKSASWEQVNKWHRRALARELIVQRVLGVLTREKAKLGNPDIHKDLKGFIRREMIERAIKGYLFKGSALQQGIACLEAEIDRRNAFVRRVSEVAPSVAEGMRKSMDEEIAPDKITSI